MEYLCDIFFHTRIGAARADVFRYRFSAFPTREMFLDAMREHMMAHFIGEVTDVSAQWLFPRGDKEGQRMPGIQSIHVATHFVVDEAVPPIHKYLIEL